MFFLFAPPPLGQHDPPQQSTLYEHIEYIVEEISACKNDDSGKK
jgi:hypothetical protein